jgi:hypothetical protein
MLDKYLTNDYQGRKGVYPDSNVPDTITKWDKGLCFDFKNTGFDSGKRWVKNWLKKEGLSSNKIHTYQTGDYQNDWIEVVAYDIR